MQLSILVSLAVSAAPTLADYWKPEAGLRWQIVLSGDLIGPYPASIKAIDGDLYSNNESTWSDLKASGIKTICYFSAGSYEDWRPDAHEFNNQTDLGSPIKGWNGEWWLNTKSDNVRRIMGERMDLARQKGCDAVDPDNVDAYDNENGLGLTEDDAVDYVRFLAAEAHKRNLAVGLKNAGSIVDRVLDVVDFQVNEQCEEFDECDQFRPFIDANKPVFGIEYTKKDDSTPSRKDVEKICTTAAAEGFSTVIKHMSLNDWVVACNITSTARGNSSSTSNGTSIGNSTASTSSSATSATYSSGASVHQRSLGVVGLLAVTGVLCCIL
ncbi:glycoside hydrolase family 114 protein [Dothistroma septosporum NZE10]|uniref:alpha-galactosidase n=1 Tax=Dothistroma septosporum (strain NZE10 / CBS 128990) TaxID=675120 RepID=N1Q0I7_DOTSN|nr:glycoside hydrolase family 114 protein [Dothistroma septosporum NZE10]